MKVKDDIEYFSDGHSEFPELYPWSKVDSERYSNLGCWLSISIIDDLRSKDRLLVPGLRKALNILAEVAEVY